MLSLLFCVSFFVSEVKFVYSASISECGDTIYTLGDDEFCIVDLETYDENCTTFNASYNIAATNGLAMNPDTGDIYIIASIGANNGDRSLMLLDQTTFKLTTIATYTSNNNKLAAIAYTCSTDEQNSGLYGITGSQADHSLYSVDTTDGTLTKIGDLDASSVGNGLTYSPYDDSLYRVGGTNVIDIEQIDYQTIQPNVTIESDTYLNHSNINAVRALGYATENFLFLIDTSEQLWLFNSQNGNEIYNLTQLNDGRKHKGIVCANYASICNNYFGNDMTTTGELDTPPDMTTDSMDDDSAGFKIESMMAIIIGVSLMVGIYM